MSLNPEPYNILLTSWQFFEFLISIAKIKSSCHSRIFSSTLQIAELFRTECANFTVVIVSLRAQLLCAQMYYYLDIRGGERARGPVSVKEVFNLQTAAVLAARHPRR
jgi:hypothetical protein